MPIGFSVCTVAGVEKNFLQHHVHFLCVLLANACAGMFFTNAWYRANGPSAVGEETEETAPPAAQPGQTAAAASTTTTTHQYHAR